MRISRRSLLAGAASLASCPADAWRYGKVSGVTNFSQGAIGGGGYSCEFSLSDDGATVITRADTYEVNILNRSTGFWNNIFKSTVFPITWTQGAGTHGVAVAPSDSSRVYICCNTNSLTLGVNDRPYGNNAIWRSDNGGATFTMTAMTEIMGDVGGNRLNSSKMVVDPNNKDIVYVANQAGVLWRTYDGGTNWSMVTDLLSAIQTTTINTGNIAGTHTFYLNHIAYLSGVNALTAGGTSTYVFNITHPQALGQAAGPAAIGLVTLNDPSAGIDKIDAGDYTQAPGQSAGDTVYLSSGGCTVVFDKMGGTVANPGGSGVASKVIYVGWVSGAAGVWRSLDGGATWAVMAGSPTCCFKPKISRDANGGVLYLADLSGATPAGRNCMRWVGPVAPSGSSLSTNTWTNINVTSGNVVPCGLPDWSTPGRVAFFTFSDNIAMSNDWGDTTTGFRTVTEPALVGSGDPPWLAVTGNPWGSNFGDVFWDPQVSGRLYLCNGIGIFYTDTPDANPTVWTSHTKGLDSLTTQSIVKAPSPNGNILVAVQDRSFFCLSDPAVYPTVDHPHAEGGGGGITQAGFVTYSDSDPTITWGSRGTEIWRSANSGNTWARIASFGVGGFVTGQGKACLASISPTSILAAPNYTGGSIIQFGTVAGDPQVQANWTWAPSLFGGSSMASNGTFDYGTNGKFICSDGAGNYFIFYKSGCGPSGFSGTDSGLYKSTDGGATFTFVVRPLADGQQLDFWSGNQQPVYAVMPGFPNIHFYSPGGGFSPSSFGNVPTPLKVSLNGGLTWANISGTHLALQVAFGKAKPGNTYPSIFYTGAGLPYPAPFNVWRCDDFNNTSTMTFVALDNIKICNCEGSRCLSGDPDTYGRVYIGTGSSGYVYGTIS